MAAGDTTITLVGNLVDDPELRFTPNGQAVAKFRVASTPRYLDKTTNEWKDGDSLFLTCSVWRQAAENVAESLQRGMRVIVAGRLKQRSYETKEGEKRTVFEVDVDEVGPSLRSATAKVNKASRSGGGFGGGSSPSERTGGPVDEWSTPAPAAAGSGGGGWGGGSGSSYGDEPPF
jgi:single-strand DNA-binding protein